VRMWGCGERKGSICTVQNRVVFIVEKNVCLQLWWRSQKYVCVSVNPLCKSETENIVDNKLKTVWPTSPNAYIPFSLELDSIEIRQRVIGKRKATRRYQVEHNASSIIVLYRNLRFQPSLFFQAKKQSSLPIHQEYTSTLSKCRPSSTTGILAEMNTKGEISTPGSKYEDFRLKPSQREEPHQS